MNNCIGVESKKYLEMLSTFFKDFGDVGNVKVAFAVGEGFDTSSSVETLLSYPSFIVVDDVNGNVWKFGFGVDSSTPAFWLVNIGHTSNPEDVKLLVGDDAQQINFIEFDNLLEFIKTGTCVETVEPTHYVVHGGQHFERMYGIDDGVADGIQIGDNTFIRTLYKAQMEMIHAKACHHALNPEYDDVEPRVLPDLEVISKEDYDNLVRENREG
ncbi:hypothetical protein [Photobacterium swingsii]|uniref:hypothetical protein n=1 Tax=Photobacterium swingsii TaxID=680026 RepID=UPI0040683AE1